MSLDINRLGRRCWFCAISQVFITHNFNAWSVATGSGIPKEKATFAEVAGIALINLNDTLIISAYHKIIKEVRR